MIIQENTGEMGDLRSETKVDKKLRLELASVSRKRRDGIHTEYD